MPLHDRLVQVVNPRPAAGDRLQPFSAYSHVPNIVLLGDPGAGKSYLFRQFANAEGAKLLVARAFLNVETADLLQQSVLFIDALDERRTGRGDHSAVDEMVRKLHQVRPQKVRIACRAADWLGETDLVGFETYFERTGGCVVLGLLPLSEMERAGVLAEAGIEDAAAFLIDASERGLGDLLGNPQNLMMLAEVVRKRNWPSTRSELYRSAVELLLEEHSSNQRRRPAGRYSPNELRGPAGELCAVRLVSDMLAVGLAEDDRTADLPSYRSVCSGDKEKALASLGRRVFVSGPVPESADYAHRTIAEYLGASWLAERVRDGLPFRRVSTLLGVDGRPASELRGLHAWLAVHLTEYSQVLIDADAFGVLSYGDAKALSPELRRYLLQALARLAEVDPWFRDGHWSSSAVAGLSGPDMVEGFRAVLASPSSGFCLRTLVLDALSSGYVAVELVGDLELLALDKSASYAERESSVGVLFRMGDPGATALCRLYPQLSNAEDELRLRARIVRDLYRVGFNAKDLVSLFHDVLTSTNRMIVGIVWRVAEHVPDGEVLEILDRLSDLIAEESDTAGERYCSDVLREFDGLLARALEIDPKLEGHRLLKWLEFRRRTSRLPSDGPGEGTRELFARNLPAATRLVDAAIQAIVVDDKRWAFVHRLRELTLFGLSDRLLLDRMLLAMHAEPPGGKRDFLYELALLVTFQIGPDAGESFEELYAFADGSKDLETLREASCVAEIQDWRVNDSDRRREERERRSEGRARNLAEFESHRELIRSGMHFGWLAWIAKVYFAHFYDLDRQASPRERLTSELGERGAEVAIQGLIALVRRGEATEPATVLRMHSESKHHPWWYALLAGLDEYVGEGGDVGSLSDSFLRSALMIECVHTTSVQKGNVTCQHVPSWREDLFLRRPELVSSAYVALARADLANNAQSVHGLHALLRDEAFKVHRASLALALLAEFPCAPVQALQDLVEVAIREGLPEQLVTNARTAVDNSQCSSESRALWCAAGFLVAPDEFRMRCDGLEGEPAAQLMWALRDLSGFARHRHSQRPTLLVEQMEFLLRLTLRGHPRTGHPTTGWGGDRNAWDATDYAIKMISELSASPLSEAGDVLQRLLAEPFAESYAGDIKHALAQHRVRMIDSEFSQPSWADAMAVLSNGRPAGIADLHALVLDHLEGLGPQIAAANIDMFKRFWNEDSHGRIERPKSEESCRDYLVELLRARTTKAQGILIEPEGHMAGDKRADIVALLPAMKVVVELKRDYHAEVWIAIQHQLERFYTRDPDAHGFGIYVVFWFGEKRGQSLPAPPAPLLTPQSAKEMQLQLQSLVPKDRRSQIAIVVLDVSGAIPLVGRVEAFAARRPPSPVVVKYRDHAGNTWAGRGRRPKWLVVALAGGKALQDFAAD